MKKISLLSGVAVLGLLTACHSLRFPPAPVQIQPLQCDMGLKTYCSCVGKPITVTKDTPTAEYDGRIYYFGKQSGLDAFIDDPTAVVDKLPANQVPEFVAPRKADYGLKAKCSHGGESIVVASDTPTLEYQGRLYYFGDKEGAQAFKHDPQASLAKFPANALPEEVPAPKYDIGKKVRCAYGDEEFSVKATTPTLKYCGRYFYFGGPKGMKEFKQDPQAFTGANRTR